MEISDIGSTDETALLCHTNHPRSPHSHHSGGDWFAPDGTRVNEDDVPGFTRDRRSMVVRLKRNTGTPHEGIYWCSILDAASVQYTIYVRLYNRGEGNILEVYILLEEPSSFSFTIFYTGHLVLFGDMRITLNITDNSFTLICITIGGPATTVTWTRDSTTVTEGTETVLDNGTLSQFTHTLLVPERKTGLYRCIIANSVSKVSAQLNVKGNTL